MLIEIKDYDKSLPLEKKPRSIFDENIAGKRDKNNNYYAICQDHKTHEYYAVTLEDIITFYEIGTELKEGETAEFNGERVRGLTEAEEILDAEDSLFVLRDYWGNISVDETLDLEWYLNNCI